MTPNALTASENAHHVTGASNGPTEGLYLCVKGQALRPRLQVLREPPPPRPAPRRWRRLAKPASPTQSEPVLASETRRAPLVRSDQPPYETLIMQSNSA
jgi:hypothetical protein